MYEVLLAREHAKEVGYRYVNRADIPIPIYSQLMRGVGSSIYLHGGRTADGSFPKKMFRYDTVGDTWHELAEGLISRYQAGGALKDNKIYYVGGSNNVSQLSHVASYDITSDTWESLPTYATRDWPSCFIEGDYLYSFFGILSTTPQNDMNRFNLNTKVWTAMSCPTVPPPRCYIDPVKVGDKVYFIGGRDSSATYGKQTWVYDIPTNVFTRLADCPRGSQGTFTWYKDGVIYMTAGWSDTGIFDTIHAYDIASNTWKKVADNPYGILGARGAVSGRRAYIGGGRDGATPDYAISKFREIL